MQISPFKLERYFAAYEFNVEYLLSPSDCQSLSLAELLVLASAETQALWQSLELGYTESAGHPVLRAAVAKLYDSVTADDVLIAVPEEAIFLLMQTFLRPGDQVVALLPAYQSLHEIARASGCEVTPWPIALVDGKWRLDLEGLTHVIGDRTRLLVVNFPHNPTGYLPTHEEFADIVAIARAHDLFVLCDEMYRGLEYDVSQRLPSICDLYERGIALAGLSKTHAVPGLRIGWLATRERAVLRDAQMLKDYTTICNSAPSEILALAALEAQDAIIERNLAIIGKNLTLAESCFAWNRSNFEWIAPMAGSIAFPRWIGPGPVESLCDRLLDDQGVMLVPGSIFDWDGNHFRIGLGRRNFGDGLKRLETLLATDAPYALT